MEKLFWSVNAVLAVISLASVLGADTRTQAFALVFVIPSIWAPLLLATLYSALSKRGDMFRFVLASAFAAVAGVGFYYLSLTAVQVVKTGSLDASGMLLAFLPLVYLKFICYGAAFGVAGYLAMRLSGAIGKVGGE